MRKAEGYRLKAVEVKGKTKGKVKVTTQPQSGD